jgi:hypothetical protein
MFIRVLGRPSGPEMLLAEREFREGLNWALGAGGILSPTYGFGKQHKPGIHLLETLLYYKVGWRVIQPLAFRT